MTNHSPRPRVLLAGGGVAAVEALLALRHLAGEQVSLVLVAPERSFIHRPSAVASPFGLGAASSIDLQALTEQQGVRLRRAGLRSVDSARRTVVLTGGDALSYDMLVVAVGAVARPAVPGAVTFSGPAQAADVAALLDAAERKGAGRIAFAVPAGASWSLPAYELAIMAAVDLRDRGVADAELTVVTPEPEPLAIFGPEAGAALRDMLADRGVALRTGFRPTAVRDGVLHADAGAPLAVDAVVALPRLTGPGIGGLPVDSQGFLPVDAYGRVAGTTAVYAAGDATSFPVKQGGLATQQADAVAAAVAAELGLGPSAEPFRPVLRGLLLTGGAPLYLRAELGGAEPTARELHGEVSGRALWWPPGKVAGRYLAPYLATARPVELAQEPLLDRAPAGAGSAADRDDAYELALLLAEEDAKAGDFGQALHALDAAAALAGGVLPQGWVERRERWQRELTPFS